MLAELRRCLVIAHRGLGKFKGAGYQWNAVHFKHIAIGFSQGAMQRLFDGIDRRAGNAAIAECLQPIGHRLRAEDGLQVGRNQIPMQYALTVAVEARVMDPLRMSNGIAQRVPEFFIGDCQYEMLIAGGKILVGHDAGVFIAVTRRIFAGEQHAGTDIGEPGQLRIEQRDRDLLTASAVMALLQGCQNGDDGILAGGQIDHGDGNLVRRTIARAGDGHQTAFGLDGIIIAGPFGIRTCTAITGYRTIDQARIDCTECIVADAKTFGGAGAEVFNDDIGLCHQGVNDITAFGFVQIDADRALVAVGAGEVGGDRTDVGRPHAAGVVTVEGFHFDDIGAEIGQCLPAPGSGQDSGQIQNFHAAECRHRFSLTIPTMDRFILPAIANSHSHAFQRAMAGLTERRGDPSDSFWTWREQMYRFAGRINPEQLYAIAAQLYSEMLEAGYSHVCEFHYLHHQPDGLPYADPSEMSQAIIRAAEDAGIGLTLLPVLYQTGGFDGRPLHDGQRRFGHSLEAYLALIARLQLQESHLLKIGVALHSLRAVPPETLSALLPQLSGLNLPIHIHIAEQMAEVRECEAVRGARPVQWLLDNAPVDARWTLVHATHLHASEVKALARSKATVSLCPSTEANLGDGFFALPEFLKAKGGFSIGSDSNVSVSVAEELRWLEYGQRLKHQQRNIAASEKQPAVGRFLLEAAAKGGWLSAGVPKRTDVLVLDADAPALFGATESDVAERFVFAGNRPLIDRVCVHGIDRVLGGRHVFREPFAAGFRLAMTQLLAD
jgi:formimidoylglutamate deiminase